MHGPAHSGISTEGVQFDCGWQRGWLRSSRELSLNVFEFFPWGWFQDSVPCGVRKYLIWFQLSWICSDLFCVLSCGLSLKMFHVHLKRMHILLLWDETFSLYISVKSFWSIALVNATISLLIFCLENISIVDSVVLKSPTITVLLPIPFLKSYTIFFIYLHAPILGAYMFTMFLCS